MEWSNQSRYNSFNSYKGLTYFKNYQQIVKWLDGDNYLPPPLECNLDPVLGCNLDCYFCITQSYMKGIKMVQLQLDYMFKLVDFLADWGVKGLCISGGGEPSLHDGLPALINYAATKMEVAVVTNGVRMGDDLAEALMKCRWVALSVDAATPETYEAVKGKDRFDVVTSNIAMLADMRKETGSLVDLCFKFLLVPRNEEEISDACLLAKSLGVQDFHARPVDFERNDIEGHGKPKFQVGKVGWQMDRCHDAETDQFHVYTISHKFDENFHVQHEFESCLASPLILPLLTDGNAYLCVEHKMQPEYKLGSCLPEPEKILEWWGSDRHREMTKAVIPDQHCSRCIYSQYHQQIKEVVRNDRMCRSFP